MREQQTKPPAVSTISRSSAKLSGRCVTSRVRKPGSVATFISAASNTPSSATKNAQRPSLQPRASRSSRSATTGSTYTARTPLSARDRSSETSSDGQSGESDAS